MIPTPMRRKDRALTLEQTQHILEQGEYGVLATVDVEGQPYATPLSYVVIDGAIYFHCAKQGHKITNLTANNKVSFAVIGVTQPVFDGDFSTYYESAIVFGEVTEVTEKEQKYAILYALAEKYLPEYMEETKNIAKSLNITAVYQLRIEHITGKAKRPKE